MLYKSDIVGKGLKNNPNAFFNNGTAALFAYCPVTTPDDKLPVIQAYSGLSRNQRKKNKNWAFDPKLTRIRMANAQQGLTHKLASGELVDKTSIFDSIFESLERDAIPSSQSHFVVPGKKESVSQQNKYYEGDDRALPDNKDSSSSEKWEEVLDEDLLDPEQESVTPPEEKALKQAAQELVNEAESVAKEVIGGSSSDKRKNRSAEQMKPKQIKFPDWRKRSPAGYRRRHVSHSPSSTRSSGSMQGYSDYKEVVSLINHLFNAENVGLSRHFEDDLIRLLNERGYLTEDLVLFYISGVKKERQNSLTNRQESLVMQMANTATAFGKQLELLKNQNSILAERSHKVDKEPVSRGTITDGHSKLVAPKVTSVSRVINPPPLTMAPARVLKPVQKGITIREPRDEPKKEGTMPDYGKKKEPMQVIRVEGGDAPAVTDAEKMENLISAINHVGFPLSALSASKLTVLHDLLDNKTLLSMISAQTDRDRSIYLGLLIDAEKMENLISAINHVGFPLSALPASKLTVLLDLLDNKILLSMLSAQTDIDRSFYLGLLTDLIMTM